MIFKRLILSALVSALFLVSVAQTKDASITVKLKNVPLSEAIKKIEKASKYTFFYDAQKIDLKQKVSLDATKMPVKQAVEELLKNTGIKFEITNTQIALIKREVKNAGGNNASKMISGVVVDDTGEPVIGATITVRNKSIGTVSNINGQFDLKGVSLNDVIQFSYIGMENKAIAVNSFSPLKVTLNQSSQVLDEVVAIGYGTVRRNDLTGSLSGVKSELYANQNIMSAEQALLGRVSGVLVRSDYSPGGGIGIQIRGSNSMLGGTEPLYVVDGFPMEPNTDAPGGTDTSARQSSLNYINPDDIESMEVLKDASATAIYGARGANGVVLITTKSGKTGTTQITYSSKIGYSEIVKTIDVLDAQGYAEYINQQAVNRAWVFDQAYKIGFEQTANGYTGEILWKPTVLPNNNPTLAYAAPGNYPWDLGKGTDWQNAIYRGAMSQTHTIQLQGGAPSGTKLSLSLGYTKMEGIIINSDYERYTLNTSLEHPISSSVKITNRLNFSRGEGNSSNVGGTNVGENRSIVTAALWTRPTYKLVEEYDESNPDLLIPIGNNQYMTNPYLLAVAVTDKRIANTFQNNLSLEAKLSKDLQFTATAAISRNANERNQYWPKTTSRGRQQGGVANLGTNESTRIMGESRLNYNRKLKNKTSLNAMLAASIEQSNYKEFFQDYAGFTSDEQKYYNVSSASLIGIPSDSWGKNMLISYISRLNYVLRDKYLFTATFRADGSSRAASNRKFGYFPSLAVAWRVTEESFLKDAKWIDNAKLRVSYGATGTPPLSNYQSLTLLTTTNVPFEGTMYGAVYQGNAANNKLTWEQTDQYNGGLDLSFLKSRLNFTFDFYYKRTHDLLQSANLAPSVGFNTVLMNLGEVENKGFEFDVNWVAYNRRSSKLSFSVNGAINRNKLISLGERDYVSGVTFDGVEANRFIVGQPLGVFYGYKNLGVFTDWNDVMQSAAQSNATPGEYKIANMSVDYQTNPDGSFVLDANGQKVPGLDQKINPDDKTVIGDPNPDFVFGFNINYSYKKFDVGMLVTGQLGGDVFWADYKKLISFGGTESNVSRYAYENSWKAPMTLDKGPDTEGNTFTFGTPTGHTVAMFPRAYDNNIEPYGVGYNTTRTTYREMNSAYILDGTHIKLQNISMGYTFTKLKIIKELRLGLAANNLLTLTNYPGYDPTQVSSSSPTRRGIDQGSYPAQRNFTVNIQAKF